MPTKKNISLRSEDIRLVNELRQFVEKDGNRYSLAEMIRKCIWYVNKHQQDFKQDFF